MAFAGSPAEYFASPTCLHRHQHQHHQEQLQHHHHQQPEHRQQEQAGEEQDEQQQQEELLASGEWQGRLENEQVVVNRGLDPPGGSGSEVQGKGTAQQARQAGEVEQAGEEVEEEQREVGHVRWHVYAGYMRSVGWWVVAGVLVSLLLMQATRNASDLWVAVFAAHSGTAAAGKGPGATKGAAAVLPPVSASHVSGDDVWGAAAAAAAAAVGEGGSHGAWAAFAAWAAAGEAASAVPRDQGGTTTPSDTGFTTTSVLLQHHQPKRHQSGSWLCSPTATASCKGAPVVVMGLWSPWGLPSVGRAAGGGVSAGTGLGVMLPAAGSAGAGPLEWGAGWRGRQGADCRAHGEDHSHEPEVSRGMVPCGLADAAVGLAGSRNPAGLDAASGRAHRRLLQLRTPVPPYRASAAIAGEALVALGDEWAAEAGVQRQGSSLGAPQGDVGGADTGDSKQQAAGSKQQLGGAGTRWLPPGSQAGDGGSRQRRSCVRGLSLSVQWSGHTFLIGVLVISGANALFTLARAFSFAFAGGSRNGAGGRADWQQAQWPQLGCVRRSCVSLTHLRRYVASPPPTHPSAPPSAQTCEYCTVRRSHAFHDPSGFRFLTCISSTALVPSATHTLTLTHAPSVFYRTT